MNAAQREEDFFVVESVVAVVKVVVATTVVVTMMRRCDETAFLLKKGKSLSLLVIHKQKESAEKERDGEKAVSAASFLSLFSVSNGRAEEKKVSR